MWPLDGRPHVTSRRCGRAALIAAVTSGLAVLHTCHAFLTSSSPGPIGKLRLNPNILSSELPVPEPLVASDFIMHSSDSSWKVVSGVALLIGAAARCMSQRQRAHWKNSPQRFSVVSCKSTPAGTLETQSCKQVAVSSNLLDIGVLTSDKSEKPMIQVPFIPVAAKVVMPARYMSSQVPVLSADAFCGYVPSHRNTAGCARRAGKARCSSKRYRAYTSGCATQAARRNVGARLEGVQHVEVQRVAYDPSCIRNKLQVGLQMSSRTHLASSREAKSSSAMKSSTKSSGLNRIQASDLGGITLEQKI